MVTVHGLTCEYKKNPIGIETPHPRISWKLVSGARGAVQSAYRIQVSEEPDFHRPVWDTGKVPGEDSVHIEYDGEPLRSRSRYYYRVSVWDEAGRASDWSETAYWETALRREEWEAKWVSAGLAGDDAVEACDYFRTTFAADREVKAARLYVTSLGLYRVYVNGQAADDSVFAPGWTSYNHRLQYQTYDVTALIRAGKNAVGAIVGNGWYKGNLAWEGKRDFYGDRRALLLQLAITFADGTERIVRTDGNWKCSGGPLLRSELYHGEIYDARLEEEGWNEPGFRDDHWQAAAEVDKGYEMLVAQENDPCRIVQELRPVAVFTAPNGETIVDMGQNMVGWVRFSAAVEAGRTIRLTHAEVLDRDGNFYTGNLRTAEQTVVYTAKGSGEETYEPFFSFQGFRYTRVEGLPAEELADRLVGCVIHTDMEPTGSFECSSPLLNQLQHNIVWGQKGNFLDVPTDCPQRDERLGWTGDAQVFIRTASFNFNVAPFFTKWLKDLAADQQADGGVPHVVPDISPAGYNSAAWGDAAIICPWTIFECYGDVRILETQYPSMKAWVEYVRAQGDQEFLWNTGFHFGDWLALDGEEDSSFGATPNDLIATAFYAYSSGLLAKAASVLGYEADARQYDELHRGVVDAFRDRFVTPEGRLASSTQTAHVLALMFDLLEEEDRPGAARTLAQYVRDNGTHLTTGFVGTPYLCFVLTRFGYNDLAYDLVLQEEYPSWLYSVRQGATTIWEHWDGIKPDGSFWSDAMNSYNHYAYGSIGDWLYRVAAGIDVERPGYKQFTVEPRFGQRLAYASAELESMYGKVASAWRRMDGGRVDLEVTVPANTKASVIVPCGEDSVTEDGTSLARVEGVQGVSSAGGRTAIAVGAGTYRFRLEGLADIGGAVAAKSGVTAQ